MTVTSFNLINMASDALPSAPPAQLKAVQAYLKAAQTLEATDPVVAYWLRLYSTEASLKIDRQSPECKSFILALMNWLEKFKSTHKENEAVSNQTVGQAHYENFAMNLYNKVDTMDRAGTADMRTVRMFYMVSVLLDGTLVFGPITEDIKEKARYAKFKAAYIQKCLKAGITPKAGPVEDSDLEVTSDANPSSSHQDVDGLAQPLHPETPSSSATPDRSTDAPSTKPDELTFRPSMPPSLPPMMPMATQRPAESKPNEEPSQMPGVQASSLSNNPMNESKFTATNGAPLGPEAILLGQKYCKFANSALQYDDVPTAVENLQKALKLLTTGQKPT